MKFEELNIKPELIEALKVEQIEEPTKIQQRLIPAVLSGQNVTAQSQTGTGKTLAYLLPIFQQIDLAINNNQVIIFAPTHELAMQIHNEATKLAQNAKLAIKSMPIIGNVNIKRQIENLKKKPQIIVGSIGRIDDLIKQKKIKIHTVKTVVIDEADTMLSEDFNSIKHIINNIHNCQVLFVSATMPVKALNQAKDMVTKVEIISVDDSSVIAENTSHIYFYTSDSRDKIKLLRKALHAIDPHKAIIFVRKNIDAVTVLEDLAYHGIKAIDLHSCNTKQERQKAMENFRKGNVKLLIASDMAARGLDVKGVTHVFNYNLSSDHQDYIHRIGRTGRAGEKGVAVTIADKRDENILKTFAAELKIDITLKKLSEGKVTD